MGLGPNSFFIDRARLFYCLREVDGLATFLGDGPSITLSSDESFFFGGQLKAITAQTHGVMINTVGGLKQIS